MGVVKLHLEGLATLKLGYYLVRSRRSCLGVVRLDGLKSRLPSATGLNCRRLTSCVLKGLNVVTYVLDVHKQHRIHVENMITCDLIYSTCRCLRVIVEEHCGGSISTATLRPCNGPLVSTLSVQWSSVSTMALRQYKGPPSGQCSPVSATAVGRCKGPRQVLHPSVGTMALRPYNGPPSVP